MATISFILSSFELEKCLHCCYMYFNNSMCSRVEQGKKKVDNIGAMSDVNWKLSSLVKMLPYLWEYINVYQVDGVTGKTYTYNDVITRSEKLAAGLQQLGVQKNDVVCLLAPNHIDYGIVFYATALCTAVFQAVNPLFTIGNQLFILNGFHFVCLNYLIPFC